MSFYGERFKFDGGYAPQTLWMELHSSAYPITRLESPGSEVALATRGLVAWADSRRINRSPRLSVLDREVGMVRGLVGFSGNHLALIEHYDLQRLTRREEHQEVPGVAVMHLAGDHVNTYRTLGAVTAAEPEYRVGRASQTRPVIDSPHIGGGLYSQGVSREQMLIRYKQVNGEPELFVRHMSAKRSENAANLPDDPTRPFSSHNVTFVMGETVSKPVADLPTIPTPREEALTATTGAYNVAALRAEFDGRI